MAPGNDNESRCCEALRKITDGLTTVKALIAEESTLSAIRRAQLDSVLEGLLSDAERALGGD